MNESLIKAVGISSLVIFLTFYFFLNRRIKDARLIHTSIDDVIPFIAWSVFPYLFFYGPLLYGSIFISYFQNLRDFYFYSFSLFFVLLESFLIFIFFPTKVREYTITTKSVWNTLVTLIYKYDKRVTAFPSLHVGVSLVCSYHLAQWYPDWTYVCVAITGSIVISTVTLKQHSILDIAGGFITGISSILFGKFVFVTVERFLLV